MAVDAYSGDAKPRCETTMRNHDAKPRYETTMRNLDAKREQEPFIHPGFNIRVVQSLIKGNDCIKNMKQHCGGGSEKA